MSLIDWYVGIKTPKLQVPSDFKPTLDGRGWLIPPFGKNPIWSWVVAVLPALLGTILIFMDQQITAVIVNRKENKLKVSEWGGGGKPLVPCSNLFTYIYFYVCAFLLSRKAVVTI